MKERHKNLQQLHIIWEKKLVTYSKNIYKNNNNNNNKLANLLQVDLYCFLITY
ncbi:MAG: hypothetical protein N7Q72_06395 [Spiroplasma sp. Tabriz.8]|nr:hypothetical protein [Spiroplasma sp. Tabriz.8]